MKSKLFWAIFVSIFTVACNQNEVFIQYNSIAPEGWNKNVICSFDIPISDTTANYNLYVNIRNRGEYPYQNLWLFLTKTSPDMLVVSDSIECYLADKRGKWLGTGVSSIFEMPVLYEKNLHFKTPGIYNYRIGHGMRDDVLIGINDIGVRVEKVDK